MIIAIMTCDTMTYDYETNDVIICWAKSFYAIFIQSVYSVVTARFPVRFHTLSYWGHRLGMPSVSTHKEIKANTVTVTLWICTYWCKCAYYAWRGARDDSLSFSLLLHIAGSSDFRWWRYPFHLILLLSAGMCPRTYTPHSRVHACYTFSSVKLYEAFIWHIIILPQFAIVGAACSIPACSFIFVSPLSFSFSFVFIANHKM